ncbi:sugar transferase [Pelagibacteraceae bacterium]|nr:sugar transferase [Pelagibacteraceae bacterium]
MKRLFDLLISCVLIILLLPVMMIISIAIYLTMGSPIFFIQTRPGFKTKYFRIIKFRTMTSKTHKSGKLLSDNQRITKLGNFLRKTSLDELPELINVLKGEMSIVGPRPLLVQYLKLYNSKQIKRHDMKPGITGLSQINGRNHASWDKKFKLDLWYVEHWNILLDVKILLITVYKVLILQGVNQSKEVTSEPFKGNPK